MSRTRDRLSSASPGFLVFLAAAIAFAMVGTEGTFVHDEGVYVYGGQQFVDGVPPYVSIFDAKAPFGTILCGAGVWIGRLFGVDDLLAVRTLFFLLSCLCVVAVYFLVSTLFESRWQAALSSAVFIGFRGFGLQAMSGPMPKTAALLCVVLTLVLAARRRWFAAGLFAGLASIIWQPTAIYAAMVVFVAWFQSQGRSERWRAGLQGAVGAVLPIVAVGVYFAAKGALFDLLDGTVLYPALYHDIQAGVGEHLERILTAMLRSFGGMGYPIALGLLMIGALYVWRLRSGEDGWFRSLAGDRFAAVLLTFPVPILWSLRDFQNYPDLFILLPYAAIGFGWLLYSGLGAIGDQLGSGPPGRDRLAAVVATLLVALAANNYWELRPREKLSWQRRTVERLLAEYGDNARVVAIGAPEAMVLLRRTNPTRYGLRLRPGVVRHLEEREPGGFSGWLQSLADHSPDLLVVYPETRDRLEPTQAKVWDEWLRQYEARPSAGEWSVFVPRDRRRAGPNR